MRYLLVGYGNIGAKRKAVLGDRCVATVDPFNAAADYRTIAECAPARYDAAVLAVPNDVKVELMEYLLDRGKHVLVEKPLILDEPTAAGLARRAAATGAIWYTSYNFRFEPNVIALKRHLDAGTLGRVYRVRMFYGNGTAGTIAGTWRDSRYGVLEDMATHLIDLAGFVFGKFGSEFRVWERRGYELKGFDHCILASADRELVIECSFLSWKNRWRIEVVGERGALEMDGLTKWGASTLLLLRRVLPSGVPAETREVTPGPDPTWAGDIAHFEACAARGQTSCANDLWLSRTIAAAATATPEGRG
ncbi:MAG TPA: Gfo/Idh/MocA family oxidoreductase [Methylomirabilota bacterium]|jgi:predicted dehydrogenase